MVIIYSMAFLKDIYLILKGCSKEISHTEYATHSVGKKSHKTDFSTHLYYDVEIW